LLQGGCERTELLEPRGSGVFSSVLAGVPVGTDYAYRLDQGRSRPDPVSRYRPLGVHGPSRIVDPELFRWSDQGWTGVPAAELVIYELHIGTFTSVGTFDSAISQLPRVAELGVTAIEIMPVAEFPGGRNWGYDGVSLYAPQSTYGGPDGLRRLVDACHRTGLGVILDVVYNHIGPEGNYLPEFGPYFSDRHSTAWGDGWNLDGPDSVEVRRYLLDNALYWIMEYHIDGFRLDAADKIIDQSATHLLKELVLLVKGQADALGRHIALIAESDANDPRFIEAVDDGGYGLDAQWSDDFHHAVHAALTGERQGTLQDFGGVQPIAKALRDRFVNDGRYSRYRQRRYGRPAGHLPSNRFVVFVQNHDQVGNRAGGERLSLLVSPNALRLAAATLLLSPYVPLLFMGEEYGELNPFLYFVSHSDLDLVEAVRQARRCELGAFGGTGETPDPQSEDTFVRSTLDWSRLAAPSHRQLRNLYADLIWLRRTEPALRPGIADVSVSYDEPDRWVRLLLSAPRSLVGAAFNFSSGVTWVPLSSACDLILSTDDHQYGGSGGLRMDENGVSLPPLSAAVFRAGTELR
jgi:maltooligosyltrehalose trehalohydrolase